MVNSNEPAESTDGREPVVGGCLLSRRRLLAYGAGLTAAGALSACTSNAPSSGAGATGAATAASGAPPGQASNKPLTIALIMQQTSAQSQQAAVKAFQGYVASRKLPWTVDVQNANGDPGTVANMITNAATKKVDAAVVGFQQLAQMDQPLQALKNAGVPLFTLDGGITFATSADFTSDNYVIGSYMGSFLANTLAARGKLKTGANVCAIYYNGSPATLRRADAFKLVMSQNPWIKILDSRVITAQAYIENTTNIVTDWLTRFDNKVDAFFMPWDEPAAATAQVIKRNGLSSSQSFVVGADGTSDEVKAMVSDPNGAQLMSCAQAFELWTPLCASYIERIIGNGEPQAQVLQSRSVELPVSVLVRGVNMEAAAKQTYPWQEMSYPDIIKQQATKVAGL